MVTGAPTSPLRAERSVIVGVTMKFWELVALPTVVIADPLNRSPASHRPTKALLECGKNIAVPVRVGVGHAGRVRLDGVDDGVLHGHANVRPARADHQLVVRYRVAAPGCPAALIT